MAHQKSSPGPPRDNKISILKRRDPFSIDLGAIVDMLEELETVDDQVDLSDIETSQLASDMGSKRARTRSRTTSKSIKKRAMMSSRDKLFHFYENNDCAMVRHVS